MTDRQKAHIFVSYSRSDRIAVDKLVKDLRARHYRLWMDVDPQGIEPGEDWRAELVKQMSSAEAVLACGSPDFLASPYCQEEIAQAKRENKPIYPVLVRRLNSGQSLEAIGIHQQYADLTGNYDAELKRLMMVLPRPPFPAKLYMQYALRAFAAVLLVALLIGGIALAVRAINPPVIVPTPVILPTATPSLAGYDLKVVVAPFALDPALSEADRILAADLELGLSRDMEQRIRQLNDEGNVDIGFLGVEQIPPLLASTESIPAAERDQVLQQRAAGLATSRNFDMVFYGTITRGENGLQIAPQFYIPPERFTEALEMTGSQRFGAQIVLTNTNLDTTYETSTQLQSRVEAMVYTVQGISEYIAERYSQALQAFTRASELPGWTEGKAPIYVLQGNVYLQLARNAITNCLAPQVLQQLDLAETEYQRALDEADGEPAARTYAALAEVSMMRSTWLFSDEADPCKLGFIDEAESEQALQYSEAAVSAPDFEELDPALQAAVLFTRVRAQATYWYVVDTSDPLFDSLVDNINAETDQIITVYQANPENTTLIRTAFEALLLRGVIQLDYNGTCMPPSIEDFSAALEIARTSNNGVESSRQMTAAGAFGQCYEMNEQTDNAIEQYRVAYDIARTITAGTQNREFYGCKLELLTGDESITTSACEE